MSNKRLRKLTNDEREALEDEGHQLLRNFSDLMEKTYSDETHIPVVESHYMWAKKFICENKTGYQRYINTYMFDIKTKKSINSVKDDLAPYIHRLVTKNLSKIKP